MMRNPFTHFIIAFVLLLVVCCGYAYWYHIVETKSAEVQTLKSQIQSKTQDVQRSQLAKQELVSLNSDEGTIEQYFVSTNDVVPFLEQLADTGKYLGSDVEVVSVSANPGDPYGELQLSLKITGTFNSVLKTMGSIEYGPYGTKVTSFTFDSSATNASSTVAQNWTATALVYVGTETGGSAVETTNDSSASDTSSTQTAPTTSVPPSTSTSVSASSPMATP